MKTSRVIALIIGCLMLLPAVGLLLGGGVLGAVYLFGRNDEGYFAVTLANLKSPTAAISAENPGLTVDLSAPNWLIDSMNTEIRLSVSGTDPAVPIFAGIGPSVSVNEYLTGVSHDEYVGGSAGKNTQLRRLPGAVEITSPVNQSFWTVSAVGSPALQFGWDPTTQPWSMVVMNADGSPGISAVATLEVQAGLLFPLVMILLILGIGITVGAIFLIAFGARRGADDRAGPAGPGRSASASGPTGVGDYRYPVILSARLDSHLSRWKWLVKWFLAIPHLVVLVFLWPAFLVCTILAGFAILFTGRYPRGLFEFNLGVIRWSWRVAYYAAVGGIGTDRYPPFTLATVPDYPATIEIAYPARLSRGLVLVKWWLLAVPHLLIIALATTNWWSWSSVGDERFAFNPAAGSGILGLFTIAAGLVLLITGRYPVALFDLILGFNRWLFRVLAYCSLMTDEYPPFRLDQGGTEPPAPGPRPLAGPPQPPARVPVSTSKP